MRTLNAIGYRGPVSIAWEDSGMDRLEGAFSGLAYLRRHNPEPPAAAFDWHFDNR